MKILLLLAVSVMGELTDFCFNVGEKEFTGITKHGPVWTNNWQKDRLSFNKTSLKLEIN